MDVGCVLVVALRDPSQESSSIQVDPGTLAFVLSCLQREEQAVVLPAMPGFY